MLNILIERYVFGDFYTIGKLYVNGEYLCMTLEDKVREVLGQPVAAWKIPGSTAIPALTYKLVIDHSPKYRRDMPHILDVPGYKGVRIHAGNKSADTEGCILLGMRWRGGDWIEGSRTAMTLFTARLKQAIVDDNEEVEITIRSKHE